MAHAHIEEEEDAKVREFTGEAAPEGHDHSAGAAPVSNIPAGGSPAFQQVFKPPTPVLSREESARADRAAYARAQAAKYSRAAREAIKRGEWSGERFETPRDSTDRLRKAIPYKFKLKRSWWSL